MEVTPELVQDMTARDIVESTNPEWTTEHKVRGLLQKAFQEGEAKKWQGSWNYVFNYIRIYLEEPLTYQHHNDAGYVQLLYILNNLGQWRGVDAQDAKRFLKKLKKH